VGHIDNHLQVLTNFKHYVATELQTPANTTYMWRYHFSVRVQLPSIVFHASVNYSSVNQVCVSRVSNMTQNTNYTPGTFFVAIQLSYLISRHLEYVGALQQVHNAIVLLTKRAQTNDLGLIVSFRLDFWLCQDLVARHIHWCSYSSKTSCPRTSLCDGHLLTGTNVTKSSL